MRDHNILSQLDIFILCGGLGKRLRPEVPVIPKVLAHIQGQPFLGILLEYLERQGFRRVILGVGYKSDMIEEFCRKRQSSLSIEFSKEIEPLGTGGAVKNVQPLIVSDRFFVLNGDCFCRLPYPRLLDFHLKKDALATLAVHELKEKKDFGSIILGPNDEIANFSEKATQTQTPFASVGIYCFNKNIFDLMPEKNAFSIETEFFPTLVGKKFYGFKTKEAFIDIGTPERYKLAQDIIKNL
ncbi:MAG: sugar phosphate nucleotidyltransferase [Candidatus Omnitrophota bacterium]